VAQYLEFIKINGLMMHLPKRFLLLDVSRWIAAIGVIGFHLGSGWVMWTKNLYLFVDFFFVLSGFVLASKFPVRMRRDKISKFVFARFMRLAPMTYTTLLFTIMIEIMVRFRNSNSEVNSSPGVDISFPVIVNCLLLLQIFSPTALLLNYPLWSLSVEWVTNLILIPFIACKDIIKIFLFFSFQLTSIFVALNEISTPGWLLPMLRGLNGVLLGVLAKKYFEKRVLNYPNWIGVCSIGVILPVFSYDSNFPLTLLSIPFAAFIISIARMEPNKPTLKTEKLAMLMGKNSFGVYVWHVPVAGALGIIAARVLGEDSVYSNNFYMQLILVTLVSVFVSLNIDFFIDKFIRKFSPRSTSKP
jgi:peptidoglycan/LPS O-acetylase OafA/YrhL